MAEPKLGIGKVQTAHASDQFYKVEAVLPQARAKPWCWKQQWKSRQVINGLQHCDAQARCLPR